MPLIEREPNVVVIDLLEDQWEDDNISGEFDTSWISTGWWNEDSSNPQVTLTQSNPNTRPNGLDPTGRGFTSFVEGSISCNIWSPSVRSEDGTDWKYGANPKTLRWDLVREIHRIIENNQDGTTDSQGNPELVSIRTGRFTLSEEPGETMVVYRATLPIDYMFHTRPER